MRVPALFFWLTPVLALLAWPPVVVLAEPFDRAEEAFLISQARRQLRLHGGGEAAESMDQDEATLRPPTPGPALSEEDRVRIARIDWEAVKEEAAALLSAFVKIPSVSGTEAEKAAGDFLTREIRRRGLQVKRLDIDDGRPNVLAATRVDGDPRLLLLGHLDVVDAKPEHWTHPPFSGARADGAVWGRGSFDNKGAVIMQLMALSLLERTYPDYPHKVGMLTLADEERGSEGARWVAEHHLDKLGGAPMIGEGGTGILGVDPVPPDVTLFPIATAEKSPLWLELHLDLPSSGHGSVPPLEHANRIMVLALNRLIRKRQPMRLIPQTKTLFRTLAGFYSFPKSFFLRHPDIPGLRVLLDRFLAKNPLTNALVRDTATITVIEVESSGQNAIPRKIVAKLDCRLLPGTDQGEFLARIADFLDEPRIEVRVTKSNPGAPGSVPNDVYAALEASVLETTPEAIVTPFLFPASSDSNIFRARGHDVYGLVPAALGQAELAAIHGTDERLREDALVMGVRVFYETLLRLRVPLSQH